MSHFRFSVTGLPEFTCCRYIVIVRIAKGLYRFILSDL